MTERTRMAERGQQLLLHHLTTEPGTLFIAGDKSPQHIETIDIFKNNTAAYTFMKSSPFPHEINDKMNCELEKKGWEAVGDIIYREKLSFEELINCVAFGIGYRKVYESKRRPPLMDTSLTVFEFLNLVDNKAKEELERIKRTHEQELLAGSGEGILKIVLTEGHRLKQIVD